MQEASLYPLLVDGAIEEGWQLFRIADGSPGRKPFDVAGAAPDGRAVGVEVKVVRTEFCPDHPLPWELFAVHQMAWLKLYGKVGAIALAALYEERTGAMGLYQIKRKRDFALPARRLFKGQLLRVDAEYRGWGKVFAALTPRPSRGG